MTVHSYVSLRHWIVDTDGRCSLSVDCCRRSSLAALCNNGSSLMQRCNVEGIQHQPICATQRRRKNSTIATDCSRYLDGSRHCHGRHSNYRVVSWICSSLSS